MPHLGHLGLLSVGVQQDSHRLHVTLAGGNVQGRVASCGGGVGAGLVVQQQLYQFLVAHPGSAVQGRLVVLAQERQEQHSSLESGVKNTVVRLEATLLSKSLLLLLFLD